MSEELSTRVNALEIRVAHQDATVEDLNATVAEQWRRIDALAREVARLADRLQDVSRESGPEAPPPHY